MSFADEALEAVEDMEANPTVELIPIADLTMPEVVDNTQLSDYAKCPKMFYWARLQGLQPGAQSIHLHAGKAFAKAMEDFRVCYFGEGGTFDDAVAAGLYAIIRAYGEPTEAESDEYWIASAKSWEGMACAYIHTVHNWDPRHDALKPVTDDKGKPTVECSFAIPLDVNNPSTGLPYLFHGRYDLLASYGGSLFVEDDKTASQLGASWSGQWDLRSQFTGYCKGAKAFGVGVAGAIIRGTAILKTKITHAEAIVYRPDFLIERWEHDVHHILLNMNQSFEQQFWPTLGTFNEGCNAYGGCDYKQLCSSENPEAWLSNYHRNFWDPTNPDGEEVKND